MSIKIVDYNNVPLSLFRARTLGNDVHETVTSIIDNVKANGDKALFEYSAKFDRANPAEFEVDATEIEKCALNVKNTNPKLYEAAEYSFKLAFEFAKSQKECFTCFEKELAKGLITGQKTIPVNTAGLYVPAGRFPLLSSVIMCAAPALAAGCKNIILCTPPKLHPDANGDKNSVSARKPWADEGILTAAYISGIKHIYAVGGAQSIAAMAYGTESIPRCDVIAGPGNKFVQEAKRCVYGDTGIDFVAGPTEAFIIADESSNPAWVAADMLAQAEHDADAQAILVTTSKTVADKVSEQIEIQLSKLSTEPTARASIEKNGLIILCKNREEALSIADRKAPEHLELAMDDNENRKWFIDNASNYGTLFIGHEAAEVLGDYAAGLNHILPTSGSARFSGGLSVRHFLKTVTTLRTENTAGKLSEGTLSSIEAAGNLADTEGLAGHAAAARIRLSK